MVNDNGLTTNTRGEGVPFDVVISGTVVTADAMLADGWVAARGAHVAAIGQGAPPPATAHHAYPGCFVLPGLVDGHMHTSSALGWIGIEGATRSAAAGGITTCVDMPYDVPLPVTDAALLGDKIGWVERTALVDVALYGTITKTGGVGAIPELAAGGISAFKLSTYEYDAVRFPRIDNATLLEAFAAIAKTGLPVALHNEDQELVEHLTQAALDSGRTDPIMHARTRPPLTETMADLAIFEIGLATGAHVHIAHSSLARGVEIAAAFRGMGARASGEVCVHYFGMTEDDLVRLGGRGKCNPPFRSADEVSRLWTALEGGLVEYISTDHAPWPLERKTSANIFECGAGLTGMQSFAPLIYTLLDEHGHKPTWIARYCAERTARFHGLYPQKGTLTPGADCDIVVLRPERWRFDETAILDRPELRWSPYQGREMRARVAATYQRGRQIWDGAQVLAAPGDGRFVRRHAV
jgi:allantoinase